MAAKVGEAPSLLPHLLLIWIIKDIKKKENFDIITSG
jgi:hypothetical protein